MVTISDATPSAAIYYTVDGTTPTTTSIPYNGQLTVSASKTIRAIAVVPNYTSSAVGSAAYTINIPPPTFTMDASSASITVKSAQSGSVTLTVTPQNGFNSAVSFACSGLPSGASCAFNPPTVTLSGNAITTTLTITAETLSGALRYGARSWMPQAFVVLSFCIFVRRKRRGIQSLLTPAITIAVLTALSGCGGRAGSSPMPLTSVVTVTATAGSIQQTAIVSLTVD
jgi:hypothetical protein